MEYEVKGKTFKWWNKCSRKQEKENPNILKMIYFKTKE
jgi:hypothetical protein